jgi:nucleotide-binding universal stress UspA family protein
MALELALTEADTIEMRTGKRPEVVALNLIVGLEQESDPEKKMQERREALVEGFGIEDWPIELRIEPAQDGVVEDILRVARDFDQIIIGASEEGFLEQSLFGSIPQRIAEEAHTTVVMVKRHDVVKFGVRRWLQTRFGHRLPRPVWAKKPD